MLTLPQSKYSSKPGRTGVRYVLPSCPSHKGPETLRLLFRVVRHGRSVIVQRHLPAGTTVERAAHTMGLIHGSILDGRIKDMDGLRRFMDCCVSRLRELASGTAA